MYPYSLKDPTIPAIVLYKTAYFGCEEKVFTIASLLF